MGAPDPRNGKAPAAGQGIDWKTARQFWSFQPVRQPELAGRAKSRAGRKRPSIDSFWPSWKRKHLQPVAPADQRALIRRATFDLTGLPPTPEEVDAFLKDDSPDRAFAKVVDRLLASPHYGERWGRYWLDVARYAEDQAHTFARQTEHQRLALSRLGDQRLQRGHAVRSLREAADRRRLDREGRREPRQESAGPRLLRPGRPVLQEHRRRQGRRRRTGRPRRHADRAASSG